MGIFSSLEVSGAAMAAERQRADVVASNMANAETTKTDTGGPYKRKEAVFSSSGVLPFRMVLAGFHHIANRATNAVRVSKIVEDPTPPIMKYEPSNPDANKEGFVAYPAINPVAEMVDLMGASRAYQMNAAAVNSSKDMIQQAIEILK
jgi:flagellar basal-body rod protein FlgC